MSRPPKKGNPAPDSTWPVLWENRVRVPEGSKSISLSDCQGQVVVLAFFEGRYEGVDRSSSCKCFRQLVPALQKLWYYCKASRKVQFIAIMHHPDNFTEAQNWIAATLDPVDRSSDLTQVEFPIVLRENGNWSETGDWDKYIRAYYTDSHRVRVPDTPGIAVIDLTGSRIPGELDFPGSTRPSKSFVALFHGIRYGGGTIQSNLAATLRWVHQQVIEILGSPCFRMIELVNPDAIKHAALHSLDPQYGREFHQIVEKYLVAYLKKGTMPPLAIAPAILNLADDYMAGNSLELRAGDKFAIQNHLRRKKVSQKGKK